MGEAISGIEFTDADRKEFHNRLRQETKVLKRMFDERQFEYTETPFIGLEVEAWLLDKDFIPNPVNKEFLANTDNPNLVEELSKFNFEINTTPEKLTNTCFAKIEEDLQKTWSESVQVAKSINSSPSLIGIHPLIRDQLLQPENMSEGDRYKALGIELFRLRGGKPIHLEIDGYDHFELDVDHIMPEAAATSIQVHLQANQENIKRVFNASQIASTPLVAIAANSPYLYGYDLWDETRIPLFEQAIRVASFKDKKGVDIGRVTFGTGYVRHSLLELFLENLDGYPAVLPILFDDDETLLRHLRFHNGTLWRWNRPIIGFNKNKEPHLRVEQRVMASGPSIKDIIANMAFCCGIINYYAIQEKAPEESMTFTDCRNNFYSAAKNGLGAKVRWFGKETTLCNIILDDLIPKAKEGLELAGVNKAEIAYYIDEIIHPRVLSGQNGAQWQRSFINCYGKDFQALSKSYLEHQMEGRPVHQWKI